MYDRLFTVPNTGKVEKDKSFLDYVNPDSLKVLQKCKIEPSLAGASPGTHYQFERKGFFCVDLDSTPDHLVFNLTIPLRDTWAKIDVGRKIG
jgi:glutaminyl-tRNA synthetase